MRRPLADLRRALRGAWLPLAAVAVIAGAGSACAATILFVGNSFTYGYGSPVRFFRATTVTDLNRQGVGGVPALFKTLVDEAGLDYDVYLEAEGDVGLDWHLAHRRRVLESRPWDVVVLQTYSTLDPRKPGDPARLTASVQAIAQLVTARNPQVDVRLIATWPRADLVYGTRGPWAGKSLAAMASDIRAGVADAAAATPGVTGVVPVGDAWVRAVTAGFADGNPYDGIAAGKVNLWTFDNHHASAYGYYLDALMLFGAITGRDPASLGRSECAGFELGFSAAQIEALQRIASATLAAAGQPRAGTDAAHAPGKATRCGRRR